MDLVDITDEQFVRYKDFRDRQSFRDMIEDVIQSEDAFRTALNLIVLSVDGSQLPCHINHSHTDTLGIIAETYPIIYYPAFAKAIVHIIASDDISNYMQAAIHEVITKLNFSRRGSSSLSFVGQLIETAKSLSLDGLISRFDKCAEVHSELVLEEMPQKTQVAYIPWSDTDGNVILRAPYDSESKAVLRKSKEDYYWITLDDNLIGYVQIGTGWHSDKKTVGVYISLYGYNGKGIGSSVIDWAATIAKDGNYVGIIEPVDQNLLSLIKSALRRGLFDCIEYASGHGKTIFDLQTECWQRLPLNHDDLVSEGILVRGCVSNNYQTARRM